MDLSNFAFGTSSVGSRIRYGRFRRLATLAQQAGIRRFDSAPSYGRGLAQVFLQRFASEHARAVLNVSTKVGRLPVGDAKSLLIVLSQLELRHAARLLANREDMACNFSPANLERCMDFARASLDPRLHDSLFLHASPQPVLATGAAQALRELAQGRLQIGVAEPCPADLEWLLDQSDDWSVQVSVAQFLAEPRLRDFKGMIWINSIIRYARAQGIGLRAVMDALRDKREQGCVYVVGFNHEHLFDDFVALL